MRVEGNHPFKAEPALLYGLLNDPAILARCIPGCQKLEPAGPFTYTTTLNVGVASIKGVYNASVKLDELTPPSHFRITIDGKGPQGFVRGTGSIDLTRSDGATLVEYAGEAQLGGTLASVGQRMLQGVAKMMVSQFFSAMEAEAATKLKGLETGVALPPPKHGLMRNLVRNLWSLLRRLVSRPATGTPDR